MPDFLTIKRQHDAAKLKGLISADTSLADFAKLGALATNDPSYQEVANSPAWKNMIRSWSASADEAIQSGPVDDWTAEAFGWVGDKLGVTPEASRAAGRELPRQMLNFVPMAAGGAIGLATGGPPGAVVGGKIGLGITSGLSAFDAYGKSGNVSDAIIGGVAPYLGGKLSELGSKAALRSAATPGSMLNKLGFMQGKNVAAPATHTITDALTGTTKQVLGETVDTFKDKALGYVAGEALANAGFTGLDLVQQGPDAVLNRDYLFANLASNIPFMAADLPNFTKTRFAWEPEDAPLVPTQAQINAEKTSGERTREALQALDDNLAKFQKELELGVDIGRFIDKNNAVAATMEGHRTAVKLEAESFQNTWSKLREVNSALPDVLTGIDPKVLMQNPSVIGFDPAKTLVQEYAQKLKQINKVKGGNLSRIAKTDADLDTVMGLVEEDLKLPDTLLSTPVEQRTVEQYQKALGTKLSDNAVKLIRMKHMEIAQGENFVPEFPKLWEEYQKALTGKFEGSIDDRYELITASLLATRRFPKVVKAQKKVVKKVKDEGLTEKEAAKEVTDALVAEDKADSLKKAIAERMAAAKAAEAPTVEKAKPGRKEGPTKATLDKNASMEERILLASKALNPTDEDRFFIIANKMIDPANRAKGLNWLSKVATEHAPLPLPQKLLKFQAGLKTIDERVELSNQLKTVPLNEEVVAAIGAEDEAIVSAREESMRELIVEETARELDEDAPEISQSVQEQNLARDFMVALAKKAGVTISPEDATRRFANMPLSVREKNLALAKQWKEKGFPQLAANDIDPLTIHFTTGQPLPIKEFATAWAKEVGVPENEIPAVVDDFVRITQYFAAGESRFGKLEGAIKGAQFARASAGAFDFGMREVKFGQIQRPGKPPLGTKDGWMTELDFRNNGGELGPLQKDEVAFYKQLVPEAFADGKVHLQKLWDGLGKVGEQVKVVSYGQEADSPERRLQAELTHNWLETLSSEKQLAYRGSPDFTKYPSYLEELKKRGFSDDDLLKAQQLQKVSRLVSEEKDSGLRATSYYNQISPFDTKKSPIIRIDVVLPNYNTSVDNLHTNIKGTVVWSMVQIVPHPRTGKKVALIAELQSSAAQARRDQMKSLKSSIEQIEDRVKNGNLDRTAADKLIQSQRDAADAIAPDHPVLPVHQSLGLKAVIKWVKEQNQKAIAEGRPEDVIDEVAVSDGETAMMTERHDSIVPHISQAPDGEYYFPELNNELYIKAGAGTATGKAKIEEGELFIQDSLGQWIDSIETTGSLSRQFERAILSKVQLKIPQEGGMRLAYDTTLPSIMSKLVGEGKMEDFGVHKNQQDFAVTPEQILADPTLGVRATETVNKGSPVFRNADGTPKTNVTARVYDISSPSERVNTLFARGGTIYGAAFKNIAQAYFSTKAFQGAGKVKAMSYVLAHENAHIAFGKAMRGEYGPETKQLFDDAIGWVKTNDPQVLRDVEEVIRDLYLPKEFHELKGVKDVLGNSDGEEWLANAHAMMVTGAVNANKPIKALLILPKSIRNVVESTVRRIQEALKHARMYWKLSGDKDKMNQVLRVKSMMDSVRRQFREAEWQTAQAVKFLDINPASLLDKMQEAQFARSPYPVEGIRQRLGDIFNKGFQGLGGFMATYKDFVEPGWKLMNSGNVVSEQTVESLAPIFGHQGAAGNIVVDKSLPWYKIASSKPLENLTKRINLEAQDSSVSAIVTNPDGTLGFNWNILSPALRAELKLYDPERQRIVAQFLMQKEKSTRLTQKHNIEHETNKAKLFAVNLLTRMKSFDANSEPVLRHKEARVVAEGLFDALAAGDQASVQVLTKRFADSKEAQKLVEIIQEKQKKLDELAKFYAARPNFQSLRRFKNIIQRYTDANGESKVLDFNSGSEAEAMKKELMAKGWKPVGLPILREMDKKLKTEFTVDSKVIDLLETKEGRLKELIDSMDIDPADREALLGESSFLADVLREAKSNDIYLPGVKRRISGGPEHLDMLEQHLMYTQAAHKVGYMTTLGEELKYHMNNPALKDQVREKAQFMDFYKQAKESDPKFWRMVNKANAVWHIGFNLPGHLAELFQPLQTHIHEAVYQGHSILTALKTTVGAEKSAMRVIAKLIKSKIGYHDDAAIWENWPDKDEAEMLKVNWRRSLTQPLQEVYQQVGVNQETLRAIAQDREMPSVSKVLTKPLNMYSNAAMGLYSVFTQHNNLVGLLTGYRLAKKKGLSHEEAVKSAALFELTANNSGGRMERPVYFNKLGSAGYMVYALSSYVRGRFTDLARYYRHGFDKVNFPELDQNDRRAARQAFASMIAGQLAAAGILGFPFVGPGIALMEDLTGDEIKGNGLIALNAMTDDPLLTQALSYGVMSSMAESLGIPADLHSRFALSGFLGLNAYDGISAASVLGPTASMVNSMWKMGKSLVQEKDLGAAFRAGGPGGIKRMSEALSEEFQAENPDANLPMAMAGFRSGKMFKNKEMERIISKTNEAAQNDIKLAARKVEESLLLGPEVAQKTLMREANLLIDQSLEGRGRQVALKDMMSNLRQRIALQKVKEQMPTDIRGKATAQTASRISQAAQAIGYQPPEARNVEQEQIMRYVYSQLGRQRSQSSLRRAQERQMELAANPGMFY